MINVQVPKTMPVREMRRMLDELRKIRQTATMETADFNSEIKRATSLWRKTWLLNPLDALIERYEDDLRNRGYDVDA